MVAVDLLVESAFSPAEFTWSSRPSPTVPGRDAKKQRKSNNRCGGSIPAVPTAGSGSSPAGDSGARLVVLDGSHAGSCPVCRGAVWQSKAGQVGSGATPSRLCRGERADCARCEFPRHDSPRGGGQEPCQAVEMAAAKQISRSWLHAMQPPPILGFLGISWALLAVLPSKSMSCQPSPPHRTRHAPPTPRSLSRRQWPQAAHVAESGGGGVSLKHDPEQRDTDNTASTRPQ